MIKKRIELSDLKIGSIVKVSMLSEVIKIDGDWITVKNYRYKGTERISAITHIKKCYVEGCDNDVLSICHEVCFDHKI